MATNRRGLRGLVSGAALGFLLHREAPAPAAAQSAGPGDDPTIGTYQLSFQRPTGVPGWGLVTLAPGGIFLRSGDTHPTESPGHGVWMRTGAREIAFTYYAFRFDAEGVHVGSRRTNAGVTLETPDSWVGQTMGTAFDLEGAVVSTASATIRARGWRSKHKGVHPLPSPPPSRERE
jgi:hypothetical protein